MGTEDFSKRKIGLRSLPKGVLGIAIAIYHRREAYPTVEALLCNHGFTQDEENDGRFNGKITLPTKKGVPLDFTLFFPTSGCGVELDKDNACIFGTEPGMSCFTGFPVTLVHAVPGLDDAVVLVIWEKEEFRQPQQDLRDDYWIDVYAVVNALQVVFAGGRC